MYTSGGGAAQEDIDKRGQERTERVWDKISSCVDAILRDKIALEPATIRLAEENNNAIMDDVYVCNHHLSEQQFFIFE